LPHFPVATCIHLAMMAKSAVIFLLISAVVGTQEVDEASCATAPVESERSLIQQQRLRAEPLQVAESVIQQETSQEHQIPEVFAQLLAQMEAEEEGAQKAKADWTGEDIDIEFSSTSDDMDIVETKYMSDYPEVNGGVNVTKPYLEMSFANSNQIVSDPTKDKIRMFGFEKATAGLKNKNDLRIWSKNPNGKGGKDAKKVYGFMMTAVPGSGAWTYHVEFATVPSPFKMYPSNGKVAQFNDQLLVMMTCDDELACKDGKVVVSAVQFKPTEKSVMKTPDEVVGTEAAMLNVARKEKEAWTGEMVDLELSASAPDMQSGCTEITISDYPAVDNKTLALASPNTTKTVLRVSFPNTEGSQIVSNSSSDIISIYGFTKGTTGVVNSPVNRLWSQRPDKKGAMLVYGFTIFEVPGENDWSYNIEFANTPPSALTVYPKNGKVAQVGDMLALLMVCHDAAMCGEPGDFTVAAVQFTPGPNDKKKIKKPEDVVGKETALVAEQDIQQVGWMFDQVLMSEASALEESSSLKEKEDWTGTSVSIGFAKTEPDMDNLAMLSYSDFAGKGLAGNVTKTFMELSFPNSDGAQIVSNVTGDKIKLFGFTPGSAGLKNVAADRIWTGNPNKSSSKLAYGIIMTEAGGPSQWTYDIEFAQPQPSKVKLFPEGGKVGKVGNNLFVTMTCDDPEGLECGDGSIVVSGVKFSRADKKEIKKPEEVIGTATSLASEELAVPKEDIIPNADLDALFDEKALFDDLARLVKEQPAATALSQKRGAWTGDAVTLECAASSADIASMKTITYSDYLATEDPVMAVSANTTKTAFEFSFPQADGLQVVANATGDKIYAWGFTAGTTGLVNANANRAWFRHPSEPGSKLLYGFRMTQVPGDYDWEYDIEFTGAQPGSLVAYPPGGKVAQVDDSIFVIMECTDPLECGDGKFTVSAVTFTPTPNDLSAMKTPEQVIADER